MITTACSGQRFTPLFEFNYKSTNILISTVTCSNPGCNSTTEVSYCTFYSHGLYRSRVTGSHKKHGDLSQDVSVLCYYTASLVSFVGVLVIWNALNQRIIRWQSLDERNGLCTVCSHLFKEKCCLSIVSTIGLLVVAKSRQVVQRGDLLTDVLVVLTSFFSWSSSIFKISLSDISRAILAVRGHEDECFAPTDA